MPLKLIGRLHDDEGRGGDQVVRFQQPVITGFRDEVGPLVGECDSQLTQ